VNSNVEGDSGVKEDVLRDGIEVVVGDSVLEPCSTDAKTIDAALDLWVEDVELRDAKFNMEDSVSVDTDANGEFDDVETGDAVVDAWVEKVELKGV